MRIVKVVSYHVEGKEEARGKDSLFSLQKDSINRRREINPAWQLPHSPRSLGAPGGPRAAVLPVGCHIDLC